MPNLAPQILYEDNMLLVINKPAGILSQKDISESSDMLTITKEYLKIKYNKKGNVFLGLVHRLDRNTSGVMCFAKNSKAASRLSLQFRTNTVIRTYHILVRGKPKKLSGILTHNLVKDTKNNMVHISPNGVQAKLIYKTIKTFTLKTDILPDTVRNISLIEVVLSTGKPHQIRAQFGHSGLPIIGDIKYGIASPLINRPAVHAYSLALDHPVTKETLTFKVSYPKDFDRVITRISD